MGTMETLTLNNPASEGVNCASRRKPQPPVDMSFLPAGVEVISADDHWEPTEDIFIAEAPKHLKDLVPRVWFDKVWWVAPRPEGGSGPASLFGNNPAMLNVLENCFDQIGWTQEGRKQRMKEEGYSRSINYPNSLMAFAHHPNMELREYVGKIYNRYIADQNRKHPGFYGVGIPSNWWDPAKQEASVREMVDLGLKSFNMPYAWKLGDGSMVSPADPLMDTFLGAIAESGMPLSVHVGESLNFSGRGGVGSKTTNSANCFTLLAGQMMFGGVFDRHPKLKVVFVEGGIAWVPVFLQWAEMYYDSYYDILDMKPGKRPTDYWHENCYATFMTDRLCLNRMLDLVGADRIMWSTDYPHSESSLGYSRESLKQVVEATTEAQSRLILGDTAKQVYNLFEKL